MDSTTLPQIPGAGHDYVKMLGETVNPANGSVSLRIELPTRQGRGLSVPVAITYSSSGVQHVIGNLPNGGGAWGTDTAGPNGSGWGLSIPTMTAVQGIQNTYITGPPPSTLSCYYYYSFIMRDWSGASHQSAMDAQQAPYAGNDNCQNPGSSILTGSDDFFQAATTAPANPFSPNAATAAGPDGTVYSFVFGNPIGGGANTTSYWGTGSAEDRNGNSAAAGFSMGTNGVLWGTASDSLGAVVSVSALASNANTITVTGQSAPYTQSWVSKPVNFSVTATEVGNYPCASGQLGPDVSSNYVVQTLTLPNGKSFQFQYDSAYGLLNKIIYPTGGYVAYQWGLNYQSEGILLPGPPSGGTCPTVL